MRGFWVLPVEKELGRQARKKTLVNGYYLGRHSKALGALGSRREP